MGNKQVLIRLRAQKKKLIALAVKKKSITIRKMQAKKEELELKRDIQKLKRETSRGLLAEARRTVTSPKVKSVLKNFTKNLQKFANDYGWDEKDAKKNVRKLL